jgi:hypothetical protein
VNVTFLLGGIGLFSVEKSKENFDNFSNQSSLLVEMGRVNFATLLFRDRFPDSR